MMACAVLQVALALLSLICRFLPRSCAEFVAVHDDDAEEVAFFSVALILNVCLLLLIHRTALFLLLIALRAGCQEELSEGYSQA